MNPEKPLPARDANEEVAALIETLHETEKRLEILTAGEVDTVADRDGRTFLLRHAQEHLCHSEAARQAVILNALPAHIALLDVQGLIISVNEAWRKFDGGNVLQCPGHAVGFNYLDHCDSAPGDDASGAPQVAAGIRSVLTGELKSFSLEYSCHSPAEQRWFLMTVTPLADDHPHGAVVMHLDITERKDAERSLKDLGQKYLTMFESSSDAIMLFGETGFVDGNEAAMRLFLCRTRDDLIGKHPAQLSPQIQPGGEDSMSLASEHIARVFKDGRYRFDWLFRRLDGAEFLADVLLTRMELDGKPVMQGTIRDITEHKKAESRILHLNRVYALLSGINSAIVRIRDRQLLFEESCRVAIEDGSFGMAWIGLLDATTLDITPVAWAGAGADEYASAKTTARSDAPAGQGTVGRAIKERRPVFSNDILTEPGVGGRRRAEAARRGFRSLITLPLMVKHEVIGNFSLFARGLDVFTIEEVKLLTVLADDISFALENIQKEEKLNYLAYYDALTGLANRSLFLDRVSQHIRSAASGRHKLALFLTDLERFKNINDSLGRPAGDALLRQVAQWLTRNAGDANLVARVGADHFAVVLPVVKQEGDVAHLLEKLMEAGRNHPFRLNDAVFRITGKVGVALFPDDGADADTLFKNAEAALKKTKASGERYLFYTQNMTDAVAGKLTLENQLRQALDKGEFVLHYQPKVNLVSGKITGAEALIRWNDPRTGLVPPGRFIPILEETGLIYDVGRWALRQTIADYLRWRAAGLAVVRIAVNVSPLQLRNRGFIAEIGQVIGIDAHAAAGLELEITESLIMEDVKHNITSLQTIRAMGVTIAIDDFGTGFSSLSYLARLPVDTLKIDRSFVIDMTAGPQGWALVSTITNLAHSLKFKVVAEGVETEEQARLLRLLKCDEMQGYLFSKPVSAGVFETTFLAPPAVV